MTDYDAVTSSEVIPSIDGVLVGDKTSKSRRKRKKKKKKKKKSSSEHSTNVTDSSDDEGGSFGIVSSKNKSKPNGNHKGNAMKNNAPSGTSNISTPQELLRRRLIEIDGYEATLVEQAMEEMWDKGLAFDEYDSVTIYLLSGACGRTTVSTASNSVLSVSTEAEDLEFAAATEIEPSSSQPKDIDLSLENTEKLEETATVGNGEDIRNSTTEEVEGEFEQVDNDDSEESVAEPAVQPANKPTSMATKLDAVAQFENLTDAIFALTQWVRQAANEEEIEIFCRAEKTSALPVVIQRGLSSEIEDIKQFETAVQPALVRLLMNVLNRCGIGQMGRVIEAEVKQRLEQMLKQARKVALLAADERNMTDDENAIGVRISRFIVMRLTIMMDELEEYNNGDKKGQTETISIVTEKDVATLALLSHREALKEEAASACAIVEKLMKAVCSDAINVPNGHSNGVTNGHASTSQSTSSLPEIQDITLYIVDEETKNRFEDEKSHLEQLKSQVREGDNEVVQSLRESLNSVETKRQGYQGKIAELRAALEEFEAKDKDAALQIESISTQLNEEMESDDLKARQLEQDIIESKESVRYGNLVSGLAVMMKTYVKVLEKATASKTGKHIRNDSAVPDSDSNDYKTTAGPITKASASRAMEDYLTKVRKYFLNEANCANKLQHRVATNTAEVKALTSELSQYESMKGAIVMTTIIAQIKEAKLRIEQNFQADTQRIATITNDGRSMYNELLKKLETYLANATESSNIRNEATDIDSDELSILLPTELLRDVPAAVRVLKIVDENCDDPLVPFVKERAQEDTAAANDSISNVSASNPDDDVPSTSSLQQGEKPAQASSLPTVAVAASAPYVTPKFSWASVGAEQVAVSEATKYSLLDIQREEELIRSSSNKSINSNAE